MRFFLIVLVCIAFAALPQHARAQDVAQSPVSQPDSAEGFMQLVKPDQPAPTITSGESDAPEAQATDRGHAPAKRTAKASAAASAAQDGGDEDAAPMPNLTPAQASALAHAASQQKQPFVGPVDPAHPPQAVCDIVAGIIAHDFRVIIAAPYSANRPEVQSGPYAVASNDIMPYTAVYGAMACDGARLQTIIAKVLQRAVDVGNAPKKKEE